MARKLDEERKGFFNRRITSSKFVVDHDPLDISFFESVKANNATIREKLEEAQEDYEQFEELQQDIFSSLYRYKPALLKEHQIESDHLLNYYVMEAMMESPKWKELRAHTRHDKINSTVGTETLGEEAHKLIKDLKEQAEQMQEAAEQMQENQGQGQDQGQGQGEGQQQEQGESGPGQSQEEIEYEKAKKMLEEAKKSVQQSLKKKESKAQMNRMLNRVSNKITETSDMISNWGLGNDDNFQRMSYQEKMDLLDELRSSSKLKRMAELAGRYRRIAKMRQEEKVKKGIDEIYDVEQGHNIQRAIPSELMKLHHPKLKPLFLKDMLEGKIQQYSLRGKEKKAKGAIVCAID